MNILLVEDEPKVAEFIRKGLREQSYRVDTAYDSLYGEKLSLENEYDLAILDVILPGGSGLELCKRIRRVKPDIPILLLTAMVGGLLVILVMTLRFFARTMVTSNKPLPRLLTRKQPVPYGIAIAGAFLVMLYIGSVPGLVRL